MNGSISEWNSHRLCLAKERKGGVRVCRCAVDSGEVSEWETERERETRESRARKAFSRSPDADRCAQKTCSGFRERNSSQQFEDGQISALVIQGTRLGHRVDHRHSIFLAGWKHFLLAWLVLLIEPIASSILSWMTSSDISQCNGDQNDGFIASNGSCNHNGIDATGQTGRSRRLHHIY